MLPVVSIYCACGVVRHFVDDEGGIGLDKATALGAQHVQRCERTTFMKRGPWTYGYLRRNSPRGERWAKFCRAAGVP